MQCCSCGYGIVCPSYGLYGSISIYYKAGLHVSGCMHTYTYNLTGVGTAGDACPSCTVSDDHHDWRSCLKRMICQRNRDGEWEMQPPGDPQDLPEGYQVNPCENCCRIVPNYSLDNCPHPEFSNYEVRFAIVRGARCVARLEPVGEVI